MILTPVFVLFCCISLTFAQDSNWRFGMIGKEWYDMEAYEKDSEAEALVIHDLGQSSFQQNAGEFFVIFKRKTRIKIFTEAGLDYAEVEIPIYREGGIYEKVIELEGYTYNYSNGQLDRTVLDPSDSYIEKINDYWAVKKFVLPNVQPGSIIEYGYTVRTQNKYNLHDWEFQHRIPTLYSEYTVKMTPFYTYAYILQGANDFDVFESGEDNGLKQNFGAVEYKEIVHKFGMKDIPAFRGEEFITSINDYLIKLDFQLSKINNTTGQTFEIMSTWEDMTKEFMKHADFGKYIKKSEKSYKEVIGENRFDGLSDSAKVCKIVGIVKSNVDWNGNYGRVATGKPKDFIERKTGNVADVNLFLTGILRGAGLNAYPVMLSTRGHGRVWRDYPFSHFFNYVIAAVETNDGLIMVDATSTLCADNRIPPRCLNDWGLILGQDEPVWVSLNFDIPSEVSYDFNIQLAKGNMQAEVKALSTEYEGYRLRSAYGDETTELAEVLEKKYVDAVIDNVTISHPFETEHPYQFEYALSGPVEQINNKIYISPFLQETVKENPLKQQSRNHPVDMTYPTKRTYHAEIALPAGYNVDYVPDPIKFSNNDFSMDYAVIREGDLLSVDLTYAFHRAIYPKKSYHSLKFYFNELVKKANEKIVLVATSEP